MVKFVTLKHFLYVLYKDILMSIKTILEVKRSNNMSNLWSLCEHSSPNEELSWLGYGASRNIKMKP